MTPWLVSWRAQSDIALTNDSSPDFTDDNSASGDLDGVGDHVGTGIEVKDLASPILIDKVLDSRRIVGGTV